MPPDAERPGLAESPGRPESACRGAGASSTVPTASRTWDCSQCGAPGVANLAANGYCAVHLGELLAGFDQASFGMRGRWIQDGVLRPDHGPGYAECRCPACGATAVARIGAPCAYCEVALERLTAWQVSRLLTPPDVGPDAPHRDAALRAWAERLATAVDAGLIEADQARRAWRKAVHRDAAA